jgi:hypothetical protein
LPAPKSKIAARYPTLRQSVFREVADAANDARRGQQIDRTVEVAGAIEMAAVGNELHLRQKADTLAQRPPNRI